MSCPFPEHHASTSRGGLVGFIAAAVAITVLAAAAVAVVSFIAANLVWIVGLLALATAAAIIWRPVLAAYHLARVGRPGLPYVLPMVWARWRFRWLCRNAGLGYVDKSHKRLLRPRLPFTTAVRVAAEPRHLERFPLARFRVTADGWQARVKTVPRVGRAEIAAASEWISDAWACPRIAVSQAAPGRVHITALRQDPLLLPLPMADAPAWVFGSDRAAPPAQLYLGRDQYGAHRARPLANLAAIMLAGITGAGKTTMITGLLAQLLRSECARLAALLDCKGSADFAPWEPLAEVVAADDLGDVAAGLAEVHGKMRHRLAQVPIDLGVRNIWRAGLSADYPLEITVLDEATTALDLESHKGDRQAEKLVREIRHMLAEITRKGRSVGFFTILAAQIATTDSVPGLIRDNIPLAGAFACRTTDKSVTALGPLIRDYPDIDPTMWLPDEYRGCYTMTLPTGRDPFTVLRYPYLTEDDAEAAAAAITKPTKRKGLHVVPDPEAEQVPA